MISKDPNLHKAPKNHEGVRRSSLLVSESWCIYIFSSLLINISCCITMLRRSEFLDMVAGSCWGYPSMIRFFPLTLRLSFLPFSFNRQTLGSSIPLKQNWPSCHMCMQAQSKNDAIKLGLAVLAAASEFSALDTTALNKFLQQWRVGKSTDPAAFAWRLVRLCWAGFGYRATVNTKKYLFQTVPYPYILHLASPW